MTKKQATRIEPELIISKARLAYNYDFVQDLIKEFPSSVPDMLVSEYAEANRRFPEGTPYPGYYKTAWTPYAKEIMDELSARSRTRVAVWVKCSQIGATALIENFIAYIIAVAPGPTMYVSAKEALLKKWVNKRLSPLLVSCGLGEGRIFAQHLMKGQRRTGNQMFSKEFPGGSLDMISAQSESNLRQDSVRYLVLDEAGRYPWDVQGFGDPIEIAEARTANFRGRAKIFIPSTPGLEGECRMWSLYQEGDQRRYFLTCPRCGEGQALRFPSEPEDFHKGFASAVMAWETKAGQLDKSAIYFNCVKCRESVGEEYKYDMVQNGRWVPTAESDDPLKKSYQIGRLYSLMDDWERLVRKEIKAVEDPTKMQAHHNHNCGIPYREITVRLDRQEVYELRGEYNSGSIPSNNILFLTAAVDVQQGSSKDPDKPPRLEMEVCGHGSGYRTWSIEYKVFEGNVDDAYGGAWEELYQFVDSGNFRYTRKDGIIFSPTVAFVDAGDGEHDTVTYEFCQRLRGFYPIKGAGSLKETRHGRAATALLDEESPRDKDSFRESVNKRGDKFILIYTNWYKKRIMRNLRISLKRKRQDLKGALYCDFPSDYPDSYFDALTAEEERKDHTFWRLSGRANEALDLRVYNLCASDYWLALEVQRVRRNALRMGVPKARVELIYASEILRKLESALNREGPKFEVPDSNLVTAGDPI